MRQAAAFFLFLLILLSWLGSCRLCYEETYRIRLTCRMNARESAIAQQLHDHLRQNYLVRAISPGSEGLRGHIYSGDFIFSGEFQGDTVYYLLVDENRTRSSERIARLPGAPAGERDVHVIWLKTFFKDYLFNTGTLPMLPSGQRPAPVMALFNSYFPPAIPVAEPPPNFRS